MIMQTRGHGFMAFSVFYFFFLLCLAVVAEQEGCEPARCQVSGPMVQFPFRLKGYQPDHCGYPYPEFELSCSSTNATEVHFQVPVQGKAKNIVFPLQMKFQVLEINYKYQAMSVSPVNTGCLPHRLPNAVNFSSSSSLLRLYSNVNFGGFTLFNCSSWKRTSQENQYDEFDISCLSGHSYQVIAFPSFYDVWDFNLSSCTKMYSISDVPLKGGRLQYYLEWLKPSSPICRGKGKNNSTNDEIECFDSPTQTRNAGSKKIVIGVVIGALLLVLMILVLAFRILRLKNKKDDQKKIEKFLHDYKDLRPTRFSYAEIKRITNQFKDKLGEGGYGTVYKGNLTNDILVAVKVLKIFKGNGEEFINEVSTIGTIHHINVVRLVGYCADGYRRALLYEFLPNDSLGKIISSRKRINSLGWEKLQQIATGIAKGLDYLHQGCNQRILHFDIKPQNILLDQNFNPKVADFGLAKLCSKDQSAISMTAARGTVGYIAPEVFSRNFGTVSYKSDVYSFGMLLLDIVGGRKRFQAAEGDSSEIYYPEWMYKQLERGEELEIQIDNEEESRIFKKIAIVGLWCIRWCPADRPSMKVAIQMLEGEEMPALPPNPFTTDNPTKPNSLASGRCNPSGGEICTISETR